MIPWGAWAGNLDPESLPTPQELIRQGRQTQAAYVGSRIEEAARLLQEGPPINWVVTVMQVGMTALVTGLSTPVPVGANAESSC